MPASSTGQRAAAPGARPGPGRARHSLGRRVTRANAARSCRCHPRRYTWRSPAIPCSIAGRCGSTSRWRSRPSPSSDGESFGSGPLPRRLRRVRLGRFCCCRLRPRSGARVHPDPDNFIVNPTSPPLSMDQEGAGAQSPFSPPPPRPTPAASFPPTSSWIRKPAGECHKDIYEQWKSSMHHFASFNNQFYRKSIEYMQDVVGTRPSKWCAGCHDHAVFFNGRFDRPIKEQIDTPEAQAGLGCMSCHAIVHVDSTHGQRRFHASSIRRCTSWPPATTATSARMDYFLTYLNPEPHKRDVPEAVHARAIRRILLRLPQGAPGCAGEQLPLVPRLQRLRQLAGQRRFRPGRALVLLSGQSPRSAPIATCRWCASHDPGNHRRQGALAPLPGRQYGGRRTSIRTRRRLEATEKFLKSGFITVDIFAVSPVDDRRATAMMRRSDDGPQAILDFRGGRRSRADRRRP